MQFGTFAHQIGRKRSAVFSDAAENKARLVPQKGIVLACNASFVNKSSNVMQR
jgi:hypothetical protein